MPSQPPRRRPSIPGAIATATLPVITLAGISVAAGPAQAAPAPAGKAPTARNLFEAKARIAAQVRLAKAAPALTVTVKQGDTVWGIATEHKVPVAQVLRLNKLSATALIHPGDRLVLRAAGSSAPSRGTVRVASPSKPAAARPASASSHTVKSGDTLSGIAAKYHVSLSTLLGLNKLKASSIIYPGQRIVLGTPAAQRPTTTGPAKASPAKTSAAHAAGHTSSYTVKSGDTLSGIAADHGISLAALLGLNKIRATTTIYPGQELVTSRSTAPAKASAPAATTPASSSTAASHTVVAGDTLSGIAAKYHVSLSSLLQANGLSTSSVIYVGRTIKVPGTAAPASANPASATKGPIPNTFLGYTYSDSTNAAANANHAALAKRSVPGPAQMRQIVASTASKMGVDPALALAHAQVESGFNARAVSPANAVGVMQVLPSTVAWMSQVVGRTLDPLDPYDNVTAGVAYIRYLQNNADSLEQGIGGYYAGLGGVRAKGITNDILDYVNKVRSFMSA